MRYPAIPQVVRGCSCFRGVKLYSKGGEGKKKSREVAKKLYLWSDWGPKKEMLRGGDKIWVGA